MVGEAEIAAARVFLAPVLNRGKCFRPRARD